MKIPFSLFCAAAAAAWTGCVDAELVGSEADAIHEPQGTELLGHALDLDPVATAGAISASGKPVDAVAVTAAGLVATIGGTEHAGRDAELVGATFHTVSGAVELRVTRACPYAKPPSGWRPGPAWSPPGGCGVPAGWTLVPGQTSYEVEVRAGAAEPWAPLCAPVFNRALALAGEWSAAGDHERSQDAFSFSCFDGAVTKCANWGYQPWHSERGWQLHQACTRLAIADYCATGETHTLPWTPIDVFDAEAPPINPHVADYAFEAAWLPDDGALCLSKRRWQTLPLGGTCADRLPDPRVVAGAQYCEDYSGLEALVLAGALLFNDSPYFDAGLYRWHDPIADEWYTTSRFADEGLRGRRPPSPAYDHPAVFEGAVFSTQSSPSVRPGTIPLRSFGGPSGDHVATTGAPPPGYAFIALEGYVYGPGAPPPGGAAVPLHTYRRTSDGELMTTTATVAPAGYEPYRDEGYLVH